MLGLTTALLSSAACARPACLRTSGPGYLFVQHFAPFIGGMGNRIETTYVADDGRAQRSIETDLGVLRALASGTVDPSGLLPEARGIDWFDSTAQLALPRVPAGVENDGGPEHFRIVVSTPGRRSSVADGDPRALSGDATGFLRLAEVRLASMQRSSLQPHAAFLRAAPRMKAALTRLFGRVPAVELDCEAIGRNRTLQRALHSPHRLVPVSPSDRQSALLSSVLPERPLRLAIEGELVRIHLFVSTDPVED